MNRKFTTILTVFPMAFLLSSCGMMLPEATVTRPPLTGGTKRSEVVAALGRPRKSITYSPPRIASSLPIAPRTFRTGRVGVYDEYRVSGLLQLPGDAYYAEMSAYPIGVIFTGGAFDAVATPIIAGDLAVKSLRHYDLRLWYEIGRAHV